MSDGRPRSHTDEAVLDVVVELVASGHRDLWEGGVRPETLAAALDVPKPTAKTYLQRLVNAGDLVQVWGADPESYHPRVSYLPADHADAQPPEY